MNWFEEWFDENYLEVYAHRNTEDARQQVKIILKIIPLNQEDAVLDVGCGVGRYVKLFHEKNYSITGIDLSEKLIKLGKEKNPALDLQTANAINFLKEEHYKLILSLFTSWGYYEEDNDNFLILKNIYHNLKPGGFFWLDYVNPYLLKKIKNQEKNIFISKNNKKVTELKYLKGNRVIKEIEIASLSSSTKRHYLESLRIYALPELHDFFKKLDFTILKVMGNYNGDLYQEEKSPRVIFLLQK